MAVAGKFNIQVGSLKQSQMIVGDRNTVTQHLGLSPQEAAELADVFAQLKSAIALQAPADRRAEAIAQAQQLQLAVVGEQPNPRAVRRVLRWFRAHAPQLAGTVTAVLVNPLVGKLVDGAGAAVSERFRELLEPMPDEGC